MIALPRIRSVADLMTQQSLTYDELVALSGVPDHIVRAIVEQRYTPSPEQRDRVAEVLGVDRQRIMWGHMHAVEAHLHAPD